MHFIPMYCVLILFALTLYECLPRRPFIYLNRSYFNESQILAILASDLKTITSSYSMHQ